MIKNQLGNTDIHLSSIGLGAWAIGGGGYKYGWGSQDDKESISTIKRALDLGINWIDTAPVYGGGYSEKIIGQAIKGIRDKVVISTKCGLHMDESKKDIVFNLKKDGIRTDIDKSLKMLNTDVIDIYQIHSPFPEEDIEEAWGVLAELVKEGKIRYPGVSNFNLEQLKRIQTIHPVAFLQTQYHMLENTIEGVILDYCTANNIGVVIFSPMCRGLLTGKFTSERVKKLPPDDNRLSFEAFQEPYLSDNLQLVEKLRPIADRNNRTLAQLSIAWTLRRSEVTSAIVGARKPSQIEETAPAGDWVLSGKDKADLDQILNEHHTMLKKLKGD